MKTIWRSLAVSLVFSAAGLTWVVLRVGSVSDLLAVRRMPVLAVLAAIVSLGVTFLFSGLRLQLLCRRLGFDLKLHHAIRAHVLGMFSATVTPGGSGNMPAIALTLQHHGERSGRAWAVGVAVFGADALFHSWTTPIALAILYQDRLYPRAPVWLALGVAALVISATVAYVVQFRLAWLEPLARTVLRGPLIRWRRQGLRFIDVMLEANRLFASAPVRFYLLVQLYSLLAGVSFYSILYWLARGLSIDVTLWGIAAALTIINVIATFIPTPGGSGVFELGISYLLVARGGGSAVPAVVLIWRVLTYYSIFLIGPMLGGYLLARRTLTPHDPGRREP
ncbi:MAG TPA: lysylphosphatidylglycerol synthase transmembrane domain-containing protein [Trueperaceae bacterium]|nr:lysylphosphatidylglycerol synthase transmembrane domain-containing protein [Trueperaceae bacterium]